MKISWLDRGQPPRVAPDPHYPDGCNINLTGDGAAKLPWPQMAETEVDHCVVELPYPSGHENVGTVIIRCARCGTSVGVAAASRPDDARSVLLPCKGKD